MAFDAKWEDYQRIALRFARSLQDMDPSAAAREFVSFGRRYAQDRDSLPQTDADRAFHLVSEAVTLIDYQLPFSTDEEAETIIPRAHRLLEEALGLDPHCYDAARMSVAATCPSFESYYDYLCETEPEVRAYCEEARNAALLSGSDERATEEAAIALHPHLRWLAALASKALICGRNREALRFCEEAFRLDPADTADVRFTAALAHAKLEDEQGLDQLEARCRKLPHPYGIDDAWMLLARLSLAERRLNHPLARQILAHIAELYPNAAVTLARQKELPDGVFARLALPPFSEDELIVATSEATVLTQEGRDSLGRGTLGTWLLQESLAIASRAQLDEIRNEIDLGSVPFKNTDENDDAEWWR